MGLIKANNYNREEWQISMIAKAMAHPARKRIVELVLKHECLTNADLPILLNLHHATVTRHLHVLYSANILRPIYHIHFNEIVVVPETLMVLKNYLKELIMQATDEKSS